MKIALCITEDWYLRSHYQPLLRALCELAGDVVVITRVSDARSEIEEIGARVIDFDWNRTSMDPVSEARTIFRLRRILNQEKPDTLHLIALKPITLGGLAARASAVKHVFVHLSGVGFLLVSNSARNIIVRQAVMRSLAGLLNRPNTWLFAQNPDDCELLKSYGANLTDRVTMVGGAGVNPDYFDELPLPEDPEPTAVYVGRMLRPKGVYILVEAHDLLQQQGVAIKLGLYGGNDEGNPQAIPTSELKSWNEKANVTWYGHLDDVRQAWKKASFAVIPSSEREGTPRAMLEAAACARALIVTDVPGSKHFCRDGVEGFVVPPKNPHELARAMSKLAADKALCEKMGHAARQRILTKYTEAHYQQAVTDVYARIYGNSI